MKRVKSTLFETTDKKRFADEDEARKHQLNVSIGELVEDGGYCSGGDWSPGMVINQLLEDAPKLYKILKEHYEKKPPTRRRKKDVGNQGDEF